MKKLLLLAALFVIASGCGKPVTLVGFYKIQDYQWHKNTTFIKVHWNYQKPDENTIVADGFVEPFSPKNGVHSVELELVGLDEEGKAVNSARGRPADEYIASPISSSPFRITMKLNGREKEFTVTGSYYHYVAGTQPDFMSKSLDYIPLKADEPY